MVMPQVIDLLSYTVVICICNKNIDQVDTDLLSTIQLAIHTFVSNNLTAVINVIKCQLSMSTYAGCFKIRKPLGFSPCTFTCLF